MARLIVKLHGTELTTLTLDSSQEYIAGRAPDAHIRLSEERGISRHHLKFYQRDGLWICEALSKFVPIQIGKDSVEVLELNESVTFSLPPFEFYFEADARPEPVQENAAVDPAPTELLIVDEDSPDGTADEAARLAAEYPIRCLVRRGERGLATAVIAGIREARGDIVVVMDADLSHPPERIPALVDALRDERVFGAQLTLMPTRFALVGRSLSASVSIAMRLCLFNSATNASRWPSAAASSPAARSIFTGRSPGGSSAASAAGSPAR